jgi:hypothetical protein
VIGFIDFAPRLVRPGALFRLAEYEALQQAVAAANGWVRQYGVRVLNVETVVLPNIYRRGEEGSTDPHLVTSGEMMSEWFQVVRVWYEALDDAAAIPPPLPRPAPCGT